jgi:hypothetical protein
MLLTGIWGILLAQLLGYTLQDRSRRELGKDKIYALPLAVCPECQPDLRRERKLKEALRQVPEYDRLLDKFPDAIVRLRVD